MAEHDVMGTGFDQYGWLKPPHSIFKILLICQLSYRFWNTKIELLMKGKTYWAKMHFSGVPSGV